MMKMKSFGPVFVLVLALVAAFGATLYTYQFTKYGCTFVRVLREQKRVNANQDGYVYDVQIQGLYNPVRFCGQMRAWEKITIPALRLLPTDTLAVAELSLWEGGREVATLPPRIQYYPARASAYTVTIMTPWATATCGRVQAVNMTAWSSGIVMSDTACG